jgi:hypothetical protein
LKTSMKGRSNTRSPAGLLRRQFKHDYRRHVRNLDGNRAVA